MIFVFILWIKLYSLHILIDFKSVAVLYRGISSNVVSLSNCLWILLYLIFTCIDQDEWMNVDLIWLIMYFNRKGTTFLKRALFNVTFKLLFLHPNSSDIVDIKPANMEELTEVITAAEFHPNQCNTFIYSSSKGSIRLCDMRAAALCDNHCKCRFI